MFCFLCGCSYFETLTVAEDDRYDLNFNYVNDSTDFKWLSYLSMSKMSIDSTITVRDKHPLLFSQQVGKYRYYPIILNLVQTFALPDSDYKEVSIRIKTKTYHIQSACMKVFCYDKQYQLLCEDSVDIDHVFWKTSSLTLQSPNIHLIKVFVECYGKPVTKNQKIWMDRMEITVDGKDINQLPLNDLYTMDKEFSIDEEQIHLFRPDNFGIPVDCLNGKKIIALGESIHGSDSINKITVQVIKDLVLHADCKLVLFEGCIDNCLLWDAYITGQAVDTTINRISEEIKTIVFSDIELVDLLVWLRSYNSDKKEKVRFMGIDFHGGNNQWAPVADYLLTYYRSEYADEFLSVLGCLWHWGTLDPLKALQTFQEKACFKTLMSPTDYEMLVDVLTQFVEVDNSRKKEPYASLKMIQNRDSIMYRNVKRGIDLYLKDEERAVIISHYGHAGRSPGRVEKTSMGYFLNKTYKDAYFPVGIFVGEGYAGVKDALREDTVSFRLVPPPMNSLEKMCREMHTGSFYASTSVLPNEALFTREVGSSGVNPQFVYNYPKMQCDGFIFINSAPCCPGEFIDKNELRIDLETKTRRAQRDKKRILEKNLNGFY
ncbi:MAG: erythromycin esterase family protein [Dysgonamonadaceae bacterium]|nr:erythromycin esterase family protein [Dysgonamonadaceae bacterium]